MGRDQGRSRLRLGAPCRMQPDLPRLCPTARKGLVVAALPETPQSSPPAEASDSPAWEGASLERGQLGLFGVIMPGVAQIAPAFNLFFTTGLMVGLAGASVPLIFLISMVGMVATASSLAQFSSVYPSAGSFITYITRAIGAQVGVAGGVCT